MCLKLFPCNFLLNSGESHVVVTSFTHIHGGLQQNLIFQIFSICKVLKMLKISCFKQNLCISGMPQGVPKQFLLNSGESHVVVTCFTHIHSGLQHNLIFQIFSSWKVLKMLKISCFKQNICISGMHQGVPCIFLLNSGESHVVVTSFTHMHSGLLQNLIFQIFSSWKVLKMLKICCFMQNQCISGMPQGIPMQFFAQQW